MKGRALVIVAVVLGVIVVIMINSRFSELEAKANPPRKTFYRAVADIYPGQTVNSLLGGRNALLEPVKNIPAEFAK